MTGQQRHRRERGQTGDRRYSGGVFSDLSQYSNPAVDT
jgi:hypothetical protein